MGITTSSLTPETVILQTIVYQVVGRFYGEPEMTGIPCFPIQADALPVWTQLDPQSLVRFEGFDGEFYSVQPVRLSEQRKAWRRRGGLTYESYGGTALVHKNFLKYFLKLKVER
jgi:hypothetical protein